MIVEEVKAFGQILDSDLIRAIEVIHTCDISLKVQVVVLLVVKPAEQVQSVHMFIRLVAGAAISRDDQLISFQVDNFKWVKLIRLHFTSPENVPRAFSCISVTCQSCNFVINIVENSGPEHKHILLGLVKVEINIVLEL